MSTLRVGTLDGATGGGMITVAAGASMYAPGSTVQTLFARSGPAKQTIASYTPVAVTGLSVTITPKSASSIIYIQCQISSNCSYVSSFGVFKDGAKTVSTTGYTNLNESGMQFTIYPNQDTAGTLWCFPLMHYEVAGSTTARTYQVYATAGWSDNSIRNLTINDRDSSDMASFSYMTVMEIAQ